MGTFNLHFLSPALYSQINLFAPCILLCFLSLKTQTATYGIYFKTTRYNKLPIGTVINLVT